MTIRALLARTEHRPWPLPGRAWLMFQRWHDLLFAHWPVPAAELRPLVPRELELDTYAGSAWVGVVPFRMSGVRLHGTPPLPVLSAFPELNVRTYVRHGARDGVWFFSLDAASWPAVLGARASFHLPYFRARMECAERDGEVHYRSERVPVHGRPAALLGRYAPLAPPAAPTPGTLEHFLTARYCLFARAPSGQLLTADIHHLPWPLQAARARFEESTMAAAAGIALPDSEPLLHFARVLEVLVWAPRRVAG